MDERDPLIKSGRPRLQVDCALVLRLRDEEHLGWTLAAQQYRERTKQWISRDTFKRRYYEAKPAIKSIKSLVEEYSEEIVRFLKERWQNQ